MLTIKYHKSFKKDYKLIKKRGYDISLLEKTVSVIANEEVLPERYRDHELKGEYEGFRECHIMPDWLLIYRIEDGNVILALARTGSHSDLFNM